MDNRRHPSPFHYHRLYPVRSTGSIFKEAFRIFTSNIFILLLISVVIFFLPTIVETSGHLLTSFIDNDPSVRVISSRLHSLANGTDVNGGDVKGGEVNRGHNRRLLQAPNDSNTSTAVLRRLFRVHLICPLNRSHDSFFEDDEEDRRLNVTAVVIGDFEFKAENVPFTDMIDGDVNDEDQEKENETAVVIGDFEFKAENVPFTDMIDGDVNDEDQEKENEDVGLRDVATLCFLTTFLCAFLGFKILVFGITYSCVLGIVFVTVTNDLLQKRRSFCSATFDGSRLAMERLFGFILTTLTVRDTLTLILGSSFVESWDLHSLLKLSVRSNLTPFSNMLAWYPGFGEDVSSFLCTWTVVTWVAIARPKRNFEEIVGEGWCLISTTMSTMIQAFQIKLLEAILCGSFVRVACEEVFGKSIGNLFHSTVEVYFMVAWLMYYFAARCRDAESHGTWFKRPQLQNMLG